MNRQEQPPQDVSPEGYAIKLRAQLEESEAVIPENFAQKWADIKPGETLSGKYWAMEGTWVATKDPDGIGYNLKTDTFDPVEK